MCHIQFEGNSPSWKTDFDELEKRYPRYRYFIMGTARYQYFIMGTDTYFGGVNTCIFWILFSDTYQFYIPVISEFIDWEVVDIWDTPFA